MPARSKAQQKLFAIIKGVQSGTISKSKVDSKVKTMSKDISKKDVDDMASTDTKGLPARKPRSEVIRKLKETIRKGVMQHIDEGVDDPGILKMVFTAGGPASGKSYQAGEIFGLRKMKDDSGDFRASFTDTGLKVVNSDIMYVQMLTKHGIDPKDLDHIAKTDIPLAKKIGAMSDPSQNDPDNLRAKAKGSIKRMKEMFLGRRLGMIVDGTGHDYAKVAKQRAAAEKLGYDTFMLFVNTDLDVAQERNRKRPRTVPEDVVEKYWKDCQSNLGKFQSLFGASNFIVIDNTVYGPVRKDVAKATAKFVRKPVKNRIGKAWIDLHRKLKASGVMAKFDKGK